MPIQLRAPTLDKVLQRDQNQEAGRELLINPDGGMFDARNLSTAMKRAGAADTIVIPPGEYPGFELKKSVRMRCQVPGTVFINGTVIIRSELACFSGMEFRSAASKPAMVVESGTLVLQDCVIRGEITADTPGAGVRLYLDGCLAGHTDEGIVLSHQAVVELSGTRVKNCRVGLALRNGASAALYHSRIESCLSTNEDDPGVGIYGDQATLYCEGASFRKNGVGVYLQNCPETQILTSLFAANETSALIVTGGKSAGSLMLHSCVITHPAASSCAQISLMGGQAEFGHCQVDTGAAPALTAEQSRLEFLDSRFSSREKSALELRSCHISATSTLASSLNGPGLAASDCQGELLECQLVGQPPAQLSSSPQLLLTSTTRSEKESDPATSPTTPQTAPIDKVIKILRESIAQDSVRNELERILRLAHAGQERKLQGLPVTDRNFHSVFMGPPGTGKLAAAKVLAEALFAFDVSANADVAELHLEDLETSTSNGSEASQRPESVIFLRVREAASPSPEARHALAELLNKPATTVILEGERDQLRRTLRSLHGLERLFRKTLFFTRYGPTELAAHFVKLSETDQISLSPEATQTLLATLHLYYERKDKRFANTTGVEVLYDSSRHRFLERCSLANRVDLKLEARDLEIPQDNVLQNALNRSPAFISWCPNCNQENPWLPELAPAATCLRCQTSYSAPWGIWKDAAVYRQSRDGMGQNGVAQGNSPRATLPMRQS